MKTALAPEIERGRIAGDSADGPSGAYRLLCPVLCRTLTVVASDGRDWAVAAAGAVPAPEVLARYPPAVAGRIRRIAAGELALPGPPWEHVSVSARTTPTWDEMAWVKDQFFGPDECVVQYHPAKSDHVNAMGTCLHLWRLKDGTFPMPPPECV